MNKQRFVHRFIDDNEEIRRIEKMDNKKLKKQDSKRISLKQNYELTYIKKIAKELIDILDNSEITVKQIPRPRDLINSEYTINKASKGRIKRLCKFSILAVDKLRRIK